MPRNERESLIIDAACAEFGESGFVRTQLTAIADRAGVSKALVLTYFGSKEDLYATCAENVGKRLRQAIADAMAQTHADTTDIGAETVLAAIFGALADRPTDWHLVFDRSAPEGSAATVKYTQQQELRAQAAAGGTRGFQILGLRDADDLSAAALVWEYSVTALIEWWIRNPSQTAKEMTARSQRILAALIGSP
ncbi:TetR/AcrR family transcriptional regulator [Gordonia sp. CPCC 205333]|uniref:TetR/AcrR family transcriptional regulator n=1 Tax=Gordonia sp. CPCC 205333 TaxID=3140790 RepID=UPI003AF33856